jgi:hypothetical protein
MAARRAHASICHAIEAKVMRTLRWAWLALFEWLHVHGPWNPHTCTYTGMYPSDAFQALKCDEMMDCLEDFCKPPRVLYVCANTTCTDTFFIGLSAWKQTWVWSLEEYRHRIL